MNRSGCVLKVPARNFVCGRIALIRVCVTEGAAYFKIWPQECAGDGYLRVLPLHRKSYRMGARILGQSVTGFDREEHSTKDETYKQECQQ